MKHIWNEQSVMSNDEDNVKYIERGGKQMCFVWWWFAVTCTTLMTLELTLEVTVPENNWPWSAAGNRSILQMIRPIDLMPQHHLFTGPQIVQFLILSPIAQQKKTWNSLKILFLKLFMHISITIQYIPFSARCALLAKITPGKERQ